MTLISTIAEARDAAKRAKTCLARVSIHPHVSAEVEVSRAAILRSLADTRLADDEQCGGAYDPETRTFTLTTW